jgi:hypothetical protein
MIENTSTGGAILRGPERPAHLTGGITERPDDDRAIRPGGRHAQRAPASQPALCKPGAVDVARIARAEAKRAGGVRAFVRRPATTAVVEATAS